MSASPSQIAGRGTRLEFVLFAVVALTFAVMVALTGNVDPSTGDLVDTDGYMRYLRVSDLLENGDWFDSFNHRSNAPFGESQHWTRAFDLVLLVLATILRPLLGNDALYWAAFVNAPFIFLLTTFIFWRRVRPLMPNATRHFLLPSFLALPLLLSYARLGRADHHMAIFFAFVVTLTEIVRAVEVRRIERPWAIAAGISLGLWLSTEFLAPIGLSAATIFIVGILWPSPDWFRGAMKAYGFSAGAAGIILVIERGVEWSVAEYDKISIVHALALAAITLVFWVASLLASERRVRLLEVSLATAVLVAGTLVFVFPRLAEGPFADVEPAVRSLWLNQVGELTSVWSDRSWTSRSLVMGPSILGLVGGAFLLRRESPRWVWIHMGWLVIYVSLSVAQVRWATFAHLLALPLTLSLLVLLYDPRHIRRFHVVVRPLIAVLLLFGVYGLGAILDTNGNPAEGRVSCQLDHVIPKLTAQEPTVLMGDQDVGPEILYRTEHSVIATPYHRNGQGLMYVHDTMSTSAQDRLGIRARLAERDVGLILVCDGAGGIAVPDHFQGSFYESLVSGDSFEFVEEIGLPPGTDYRLFAVED